MAPPKPVMSSRWTRRSSLADKQRAMRPLAASPQMLPRHSWMTSRIVGDVWARSQQARSRSRVRFS
eukprot:10464011-Heterocapsa_arctica.AAC.1